MTWSASRRTTTPSTGHCRRVFSTSRRSWRMSGVRSNPSSTPSQLRATCRRLLCPACSVLHTFVSLVKFPTQRHSKYNANLVAHDALHVASVDFTIQEVSKSAGSASVPALSWALQSTIILRLTVSKSPAPTAGRWTRKGDR